MKLRKKEWLPPCIVKDIPGYGSVQLPRIAVNYQQRIISSQKFDALLFYIRGEKPAPDEMILEGTVPTADNADKNYVPPNIPVDTIEIPDGEQPYLSDLSARLAEVNETTDEYLKTQLKAKLILLEWGIKFLPPSAKGCVNVSNYNNESVAIHALEDGKSLAEATAEEVIDALHEADEGAFVRILMAQMLAEFAGKKPSQASNG